MNKNFESKPFVDNTELHPEFFGDSSILERIKDNPHYVVRFKSKSSVLDYISNLDTLCAESRRHFLMLKQLGVRTAFVNTYHMKEAGGKDGVWTVTRRIERREPQTVHDMQVYVGEWQRAIEGLLAYYEGLQASKPRSLQLNDLPYRKQWVYGKDLDGTVGLFLVDTEPRFVYYMSHIRDLKSLTRDIISDVEDSYPNVDLTSLVKLLRVLAQKEK